jgi:1-deoxyxylulose-5-phosphate synthase
MTMRRRDFLKTSVLAAGLAPLTAGADPPEESRASSKPMLTRRFGKTGLALPVLGMGSSPLVAAWSRGYGSKPASVEARAALVRHAYDRGVRYFDTARTYYDAEEVMGLGVKGLASDCVLATKVTVLDPERVRPSLERSLCKIGKIGDSNHLLFPCAVPTR